MRKKTVKTSSTKSSTKGNAKSNTKSNARNSVKSSVKSSAKNSPQKAVKNVAPTVENVSVKQAVIIQEPSVEQNEQNIPTRQPDLGPRRSVAFIGSECYPFVKTGGLGDVMSALPKSLAKLIIDNPILLIFHNSHIILLSIRAEIHIKGTPVFHLFLKFLRNTFVSWNNDLNINV